MMKYDEYANKRKSLDNQKKDLNKKINGIKKQKLKLKIDQFTKKKNAIISKMNKFVAGDSSFN
jgi:hypothetical protein